MRDFHRLAAATAAPSEVLGIIGSYGDTLDDDRVLSMPLDLEISSRLAAATLKIDESWRARQVHFSIWQVKKGAAP
jgi:hypothetical protein